MKHDVLAMYNNINVSQINGVICRQKWSERVLIELLNHPFT
jgi:hypothetical protein